MRPLTAMMSDDGHIFLPVTLSEGQVVRFLQGNDEAYKECLAHEQEAKCGKRQKEICRLLEEHGLECKGGGDPFSFGLQIYKGDHVVFQKKEYGKGAWERLQIKTLEYLQHYTETES